MKVLLNILFMASMAFCSIYEPASNTYVSSSDEVTWGYLLWNSIIYLFLTPIGWGILIAVVFGLVSWAASTTKKVVTTDYSKMSETEKQSNLQAECSRVDRETKEAHRFYDRMKEEEDGEEEGE